MDYDKTEIPASYDRGRIRTPEVLDLWMKTIETHASAGRTLGDILDLGCGTGRFSEILAKYFGARVIGLDPSTKMLEQARGKATEGRVRYGLGRAEAVPLARNSIDLIFMSMVFHHFEVPELVARECGRVLRDEGAVFLRAATLEQIPSYPYVPFFPASQPILEKRLNAKNVIVRTFETAGFDLLTSGLLTQEIAPSYSVYADQLAAGADSILMSLDKTEFDGGLKAIRAHAARVDVQPVSELIDFLVFRQKTECGRV